MATKMFSSLQEKKIANDLGWEVVSGSGAAPCHPGDVIGEEWLGECKTHISPGKKIQFNKSVWDKISKEAMVKRRYPVLFVDDGSQKLENTWCLIPANLVDLNVFCLVNSIPNVKTNIVFKGDQLSASLYEASKTNIGKFPVEHVSWGADRVCILPFRTFKLLVTQYD